MMDRDDKPSRRPRGGDEAPEPPPAGEGDAPAPKKRAPRKAAASAPARRRRPPPRLRLLILGGTRFLGRHLTEAALERGHDVTLFNRGKSGPDLYPRAEHIRGDRKESLAPLRWRRWDAVIDTSGYTPATVRASAEMLAGQVERYVYVSSVSAYADFSTPGVDEDAPLAPLAEGAPDDEVTDGNFGALKALCEGEVQRAVPGRALIVRPGLIVGPYDKTDRFGYWVRRVAQGGRILAPGRPERPVQFIDARDLAEWMLRMVEEEATGVFNATGPERPLAMEWLLETCRVESGRKAQFVWASEQFLLQKGVQPWTELPLWVPEDGGPQAHFLSVDNRRAIAAGLTFRRILETVRDVRLWEAERSRDDDESPATLSAEREEELLEAWVGR